MLPTQEKIKYVVDSFEAEIKELKQQNNQLKQTIEYLYECYKSGSGLIDHVEDEIKQLINK